MPTTLPKTKRNFFIARVVALGIAMSFGSINSAAANPAGNDPDITQVSVTQHRIRQGDLFTVRVRIKGGGSAYNRVTAKFRVVNAKRDDVSILESDFFALRPRGSAVLPFKFRWADLDPSRTGGLRIVSAQLLQHDLAAKDARVISARRLNLPLHIVAVTDPIERLFVSRENSLWWLTRMGVVNNKLAKTHGLANCVMFGGTKEWIRDDYLASPGTQSLCYWEITGYAVRALALEYQHTGEQKYLAQARRVADAIVRSLDRGHGFARGSLHTFNHYDGRVGDWYRNKAVMFDHGQVLMGLLELVRVMRVTGLPVRERQEYADAARMVGRFMVRVIRKNNGEIPTYWDRKADKTSDDLQASSKTVVGFDMLSEMTGNNYYSRLARLHLDRLLKSAPVQHEDHHGRAYMAYGYIRAFLDYGESAYLRAAEKWTESVAHDLDAKGRLQPDTAYSVMAAQSQLIRDGALLWKLTGKRRFMDWADDSAAYLARSEKPWAYRQDELKLGRFYRQAGALYNNLDTDEICSWASIFHIEAMYDYLSLRYGQVYVGPTGDISLIGPVRITRRDRRIEIRLPGQKAANVGIYLGGQDEITHIKIDGEPFPYFSRRIARIPAGGRKRNLVIFLSGQPLSHLVCTSSLVLGVKRASNDDLDVSFRGQNGTGASMTVYWPHPSVSVRLDGKPLVAPAAWTWDRKNYVLKLHYAQTGRGQQLLVSTK